MTVAVTAADSFDRQEHSVSYETLNNQAFYNHTNLAVLKLHTLHFGIAKAWLSLSIYTETSWLIMKQGPKAQTTAYLIVYVLWTDLVWIGLRRFCLVCSGLVWSCLV